jgi:GMP synthase (glutamine-hydrolysing)
MVRVSITWIFVVYAIDGEFRKNLSARIREICEGRIIGAISGGVDSIIAAKLMHEVIGER